MSDTPDKRVWRSEHPEVLDAWDDGIAAREAWRKRLDAFIEEYRPPHDPPRQVLTYGGSSGREEFAGFEVLPSDYDSPPSNWRVQRTRASASDLLVPSRRNKAGKAIAEVADAIGEAKAPRLPGMPGYYFGPGSMHSPGMRREGDAVIVFWSGEAKPEVDPAYWEPMPLSAYYAAEEARQAEKASAS